MSTPALSGAAGLKPSPPPGPDVTYRRDQRKLCEHLVVAVHGMGDQARNDFAQNISQLFARHAVLAVGDEAQATMLPVGAWDNGTDDPRTDDVMGFRAVGANKWLERFGFAEVHWAHIPRDLQKAGYRLEESKKWAASVAARSCQRWHARVEEARRLLEGGKLTPDGEKQARAVLDQASHHAPFGRKGSLLAATVVEEVAETIRISERLLAMARKAGFVNVNLPELLEKYLGDVQQVTDFKAQREMIRRQFLLRMQRVAADCPQAKEIHIIAHSEGTVVAFIGLLYALRLQTDALVSEEMKYDPGYADYDFSWVRRVRSFTTIGSPIDKHLVLWPDVWYKYRRTQAWLSLRAGEKIRWRNYYDYADPVGFTLETARGKLREWKCGAFDFGDTGHDHGFRRYPLPGVAHVNYFSDVELFGYIIRDAVQQPVQDGKVELLPGPTPPGTLKGWCSTWLPFAIVGLVLTAAVFIFHKAIAGDGPAAERYSGTMVDGVLNMEKVTAVAAQEEVKGLARFRDGLWGLIGCTALLYGTTVLSRVWRISRDSGARAKAVFAWLIAVALFCLFPGRYALEVADGLACRLHLPHCLFTSLAILPALSLVLVCAAGLIDRCLLNSQKPPVWGLRWMMILGGGGVALLFIAPRLSDQSPHDEPLLLLGAGIAFVYLWWLGTLLFDLAYVWRSYINTKSDEGTFVDRLAESMAELELKPQPSDGAAPKGQEP